MKPCIVICCNSTGLQRTREMCARLARMQLSRSPARLPACKSLRSHGNSILEVVAMAKGGIALTKEKWRTGETSEKRYKVPRTPERCGRSYAIVDMLTLQGLWVAIERHKSKERSVYSCGWNGMWKKSIEDAWTVSHSLSTFSIFSVRDTRIACVDIRDANFCE